MDVCDSKICRLCANECLENYINLGDDDSSSNTCDIICKHFSIQINLNDSMVITSICIACNNFIQRLDNFTKVVVEAQKYFEKIENELNQITETISIELVPITEPLVQNIEIDSIDIKTEDLSRDTEEFLIKSINLNKLNHTKTVHASTRLGNYRINTQENLSSPIYKHYICEICSEPCETLSQLKLHAKTIHQFSNEPSSDSFECKKCKKCFLTEKGYQSHLKSHSLGIMSCELCGAIFNKKLSFANHVKLVHTNERPFICEECGKGFKRSGDLKRHKEFHGDDTPFECSVCEKRFKSKMVVRMHEKLHSDIKYECPVCGLKLKTQHTLKGHMRTHSSSMDFQCNYCHKQFKHKKNLTCHLVTHTGLQPYTCIFCNQAFSLSWNCRTHQKNVHPKEFRQYTETGKSTIATSIVRQKFACGPKQRIDKYSKGQFNEEDENFSSGA